MQESAGVTTKAGRENTSKKRAGASPDAGSIQSAPKKVKSTGGQVNNTMTLHLSDTHNSLITRFTL